MVAAGQLAPPTSSPSTIAPHRTNISQDEFAYKHRLLFEVSRRYEKTRLRDRRESALGVQRNRLHVFIPTDQRIESSSSGSETKTFSYDINIPDVPNSITEVEDVQLRFLLIPTQCLGERHVDISLLEETHRLDVDACRPRWESLSVSLPPSQLRHLTIHCNDCAKNAVTVSPPYLNIITSSTAKSRERRRVRGSSKASHPCQRHPLKINFNKLKGYSWVSSPRTADIGRCAGTCTQPEQMRNTHAHLQWAHQSLRGNARPCCTPHEYKNLQYLTAKGEELILSEWKEAIAVSCTCQ